MENRFNIFRSKWAFAIVCSILFYGLFIIKTDLLETRLAKELWNLLHLFGFFVLWMFLLSLNQQLEPKSLKQIGIILLTTVLASVAIEFAQYFIARSASLVDIGLNLAGTLIAISIIIVSKKYFSRVRPFIITFSLAAVLGLLWPSTKVFIDEYYIVQKFPVLSDFSTPYELSRWSRNDEDSWLDVYEGKKVLRVVFKKNIRYSGVSLNTFGKEWIKYNKLVFQLRNPGKEKLKLNIRVHDRKHRESDYAYRDRFNYTEYIQPGDSEVSIDLFDIYKAPEGRRMNLNEIESIMLFTVNLDKNHELLIKKVGLR